MEMRRCYSTPPWSLLDISRGFYMRQPGAPTLYVDEDLLQPYTQVETWVELPNSTLILLDGTWVLKLIPFTWDVQTIARHMIMAGFVVPVPRIHYFGRSGNCAYIIMDYVPGLTFSAVTARYGHYAAARLRPQIADIVARLAGIGLSHNDLHPRNIIIDDDYNLLAVLDWDYAAPVDQSRHEYFRRIQRRYNFLPYGADGPVFTEHDECWDSLFLRVADDRADAAWVKYFDDDRQGWPRVPPASSSWLYPVRPIDVALTLAPPVAPPRYSHRKRVTLVLARSATNLERMAVLSACLESDILEPCLIIVDDARLVTELRSVVGRVLVRSLDPVAYVGLLQLPGTEPTPSCVFDSDFAHAIAEARSHAVLLCNWRHPLGGAFWAMAAVPPILSAVDLPLIVVAVDFDRNGMTFTSRTNTVSQAELRAWTYTRTESLSSRWQTESRRKFCHNAIRRLSQLFPAPSATPPLPAPSQKLSRRASF